MKILKWAAIAVTALFVLMNLGAIFEPSLDQWARVAGAVLGLAGILAVAGFAFGQPWGRGAVIAVGVLNVATSVVGLFTGQEGSVIGLVVGGLGALLGALAVDRAQAGPATA